MAETMENGMSITLKRIEEAFAPEPKSNEDDHDHKNEDQHEAASPSKIHKDSTSAATMTPTKMPVIERWELPPGAEPIIRQMAAEQILHQCLDKCWRSCRSSEDRSRCDRDEDCCFCCNDNAARKTAATTTVVDFQLIQAIVQEFPGTCKTWFDFKIDTRDVSTRVRPLLPLHILLCLQPPLWTVQAVYDAYPDAIQQTDPAKGATPLLYACSFEASLDVVQFLISKYPKAVGIPRLDGALPLSMGCSYKASPEIIDLLIREYPEGISTASIDGWFPIHASIACGAPVSVVQRLHLAFQAAVGNQQNITQSTCLHLACSKCASLEVVEYLLTVAPQTMWATDSKHITPWFWAAFTQTSQVLRLFLQHARRADQPLPQESPDGISVLHFAARHNQASVVDFLCTRFPNLVLSRTRDNGMTPIHTACRRRGGCRLDVIRVLVRHNARALLLRNQQGKLPLDEAREAKASSEVIRYLTEEENKILACNGGDINNNTGSRGWM